MRTVTIPAARPAARNRWPAMALVLMMLTGAFSAATLAQPQAAEAATVAVDQCNGHAPGTKGATTQLKCTVTVVNTISAKSSSSVTTVTRLCLLGPCSTPNGTFTTRSDNVVTAVQQCNNSDNDAAHTISCEVRITNNISDSAPDAKPLTRASTSQCAGSAASAVPRCTPPARAGSATVTQCNGSANGGGGTVDCSVDPASRVSRAIPIRVNQCNGTGNPGGSVVSCQASVITKITASPAAAVATTPAATTTTRTTPAPTAKAAPSASATPAAGELLVGSDSADGPNLEGLVMLVAALVLVAAIGALLYRRFAPAGWPLVKKD